MVVSYPAFVQISNELFTRLTQGSASATRTARRKKKRTRNINQIKTVPAVHDCVTPTLAKTKGVTGEWSSIF